MNQKIKFSELPLGARFEWQGQTFTKVALAMAHEVVLLAKRALAADLVSVGKAPVSLLIGTCNSD